MIWTGFDLCTQEKGREREAERVYVMCVILCPDKVIIYNDVYKISTWNVNFQR